MSTTGRLSVVATPIGNMEDITLRAIRVLGEVDYVLCEDTRVTGKLLAYHGISAKMRRYDAHTPDRTHEEVLADLASGKHIALVSDAGTPGISDPGVLLVQKAREADVLIDAIPGASAVTTAMSISGIMGNSWAFLGFVPHKKGRKTFFENVAERDEPVIFYESVHRIEKALASLTETLSDEHQVTIAREITKMHEEVVQGTATEVQQYFVDNPDHIRGEFVVLISKK